MTNTFKPTPYKELNRILSIFVKILQVLKTLGFKAKESGWRKTMGAYLRTEHSKFGLAVNGRVNEKISDFQNRVGGGKRSLAAFTRSGAQFGQGGSHPLVMGSRHHRQSV